MLNDEEVAPKSNGVAHKTNGSVKMNGHAHGSEILTNGNHLRNGKGEQQHVEKKRL